jgi:glutaminyl-peptide cyclotransferase
MMKYFPVLTLLMGIILTFSCSGRPGKPSENRVERSAETTIVSEETAIQLVKLTAPEENAGFKLGQKIKIELSADKNTPDSVRIWFDGKLIFVLKTAPWEYTVPSSVVSATGRKPLKIVAYKQKNKPQTVTRFLIVYSDVVPVKNGFKVIKVYPHDKDAFTQGLVYENGVFYEGTGQVGSSYLRKVEPETGKVLFQMSLEPPLFGEGIAVVDGRIYQLTWQNKVGFIYDKSTFKELNKFYYQTEGWGLTTIGNKLVMSDGTNTLYFMNPDQFSPLSTLEVYDNEKKVDKLNELEYINGEIWANIWMTDLIARIDPHSGKVIGYINLKGILNDPGTDTTVNVLNGIAVDAASNRVFVTGKNWPKLFEIKITQ